jgi:hypothetical protein
MAFLAGGLLYHRLRWEIGCWISPARIIAVARFPCPLPTALPRQRPRSVFNSGIIPGTNLVLANTNLASLPSAWARLATNLFDVRGEFRFSNGLTPRSAPSFYRLELS